MSRCWFLTWTTYGTWLPGDARNFVSPVRDSSGKGERHNVIGTEFSSNTPSLERFARSQLRDEPVFLTKEQADLVLQQCQTTAEFRNWKSRPHCDAQPHPCDCSSSWRSAGRFGATEF